MSKKLRTDTIAVHQSFRGDDTNSIVRPIHTTTAYYFDSADHAADLFDLKAAGNIYTRLNNPDCDALGEAVSQMEGGIGGLSLATGAAATLTLVMALCEAGDHIVASRALYGGTVSQFANMLPKLGITTSFVDQNADYDTLKQAIQPHTKLIFAEVITNPRLDVLDCEKFEKLAKEHDIPLVLDSTFTPPSLFKAALHGADLIVHSASKYIGGHGQAMGGIIVDTGHYNWDNGKFPCLSQPNPAYHGLVFTQAFGPAAFLLHARVNVLRDNGSALAPFNAFLLSTGLQTMGVRLNHVSQNALALATWLQSHPQVEWVSYPLLETHKDYARAKEYFPKGAGGILTFGVRGDLEACKRFINSLELGIHATNVGDVRTIISHPASTTHRQMSAEGLAASDITPNLIRLSLGLEDIEDIKDDLNQALGRV